MSKIFYISTLLFVVTFMVYEGKKDFTPNRLPVWEERSIIWYCEIYSTYTFLTLSKWKDYFIVDFFFVVFIFLARYVIFLTVVCLLGTLVYSCNSFHWKANMLSSLVKKMGHNPLSQNSQTFRVPMTGNLIETFFSCLRDLQWKKNYEIIITEEQNYWPQRPR